MIARLGQALALLAMCLPSAAIAQEWRCRDTITFAGGWSVMDQLYLDRSSAETPPLFHVSTAGFYANWYPVLAAIDAPFTAPGLLSFELKVPVGIEPATGEFVAPGATALTAAVTASNTRTGRVLFQTREPALNAALLRQTGLFLFFIPLKARSNKMMTSFPIRRMQPTATLTAQPRTGTKGVLHRFQKQWRNILCLF